MSLLDIEFDPAAFSIPASAATTVNLPNKGATAHDFNIDELNIHSGDVAPGAAGTVTIDAPAGAYACCCNIPAIARRAWPAR